MKQIALVLLMVVTTVALAAVVIDASYFGTPYKVISPDGTEVSAHPNVDEALSVATRLARETKSSYSVVMVPVSVRMSDAPIDPPPVIPPVIPPEVEEGVLVWGTHATRQMITNPLAVAGAMLPRGRVFFSYLPAAEEEVERVVFTCCKVFEGDRLVDDSALIVTERNEPYTMNGDKHVDLSNSLEGVHYRRQLKTEEYFLGGNTATFEVFFHIEDPVSVLPPVVSPNVTMSWSPVMTRLDGSILESTHILRHVVSWTGASGTKGSVRTAAGRQGEARLLALAPDEYTVDVYVVAYCREDEETDLYECSSERSNTVSFVVGDS